MGNRLFRTRPLAAGVTAATLSLVSAVGLLAGPAATPASAGPAALGLDYITSYDSGEPDGGSEIVAYDKTSHRMFTTNGATKAIDIVDITDPTAPSLVTSVSLGGRDVQSVAVKNGLVAAAVSGAVKTDTGEVRFFTSNGAAVGSPVGVGALPDMLTFTPDGSKVVVANEGEPDKYGTEDPDTEECTMDTGTDPEGSVSVIDVTDAPSFSVETAGFGDFNDDAAALKAAGVRIFGPNATVAEDVEPEYVAVTSDSSTAMVTLQENNALARVNLDTATVEDIIPLGLKDHDAAGNAFDPSDRDGPSSTQLVNIVNRPVKGMYMPDAINPLTQGGETYFVTANEGDARDYECFAEEIRVGSGDYDLDPAVFTQVGLETNAQLGRLTVTTQTGNTDADADFEQIHAFGARSFTVWDESGALVFDSGDELETIMSTFESPTGTSRFNMDWNADSGQGGPNGFDTRSDNKGPEPEASTVGKSFGKAFAFVGLERPGGIAMFDLTNPAAPSFVEYENSTDYTGNYKDGTAGDVSPEGLTFVRAADSPTGVPLLLAAHELSGTTAIYEVTGPEFTPTASPLDIGVIEPASGSVVATVPVTLDGGPDLPGTSLRFKVKGVSATKGKDFVPTNGRFKVEPGQEEVNVPVNVLADNKVEGDETFKVKLFNPKNLNLPDAVAVVTITDED